MSKKKQTPEVEGAEEFTRLAPYRRPTNSEWQAELEIKRSTFIGLVRQTPTEAEARAFIDEVRDRYPDARHHCSAYLVHQDGAQPIERSSDDGEPAGTAGQPMLEVLRGSGARDITAVVVRYFGGVLLGTGGLVRAYHDATKAALDDVTWVTRTQLELYRVELNHDEAGRVESDIRNAGYQILETDYAAKVGFLVAGDDALATHLASWTQGRVEPTRAGQRWVDLPTGS